MPLIAHTPSRTLRTGPRSIRAEKTPATSGRAKWTSSAYTIPSPEPQAAGPALDVGRVAEEQADVGHYRQGGQSHETAEGERRQQYEGAAVRDKPPGRQAGGSASPRKIAPSR